MRLLGWLVGIALGSLAATLALAAGAQGPPPVPHEVLGREACLVCHGADKARPFPSNHVAFPQASCLGCHRPAPPTPTATATAQPTPGAATPTPIETPPTSEVATPTPPVATPTPWVPTPTPPLIPSPAGAECLTCHGVPGLQQALPSGEKLALYFDQEVFASSVHGARLTCADCHRQHTGYPHPPLPVTSRREYTLTHYESCKRCHFANYTRTLDSTHYAVLIRGDAKAPTCVDCHGAHDVLPPGQPRVTISQTCAHCHQAIYDTYRASVHGQALVQEDNPDVPVCTDCHGSHRMEDPRLASFRLATPQLCGQCHGNADLMKKYGLSAAVLRTYLQDFHGTTVRFQQGSQSQPSTITAVCTDCHGVHDVASTRAPGSRVMQANLVQVCRQCHADASPNFPDAWLSHYDPTPTRFTLVYAVRLFYRILIPFIIGGLVIHILIDLWRWATNR